MRAQQSVYAIQFTTGTVKVGRTKCFNRREKEHAKAALAHGASIAGEWHMFVDNAQSAESHLMWLAEAVGGVRVEGNREYFTGVNFDALVQLATEEYGDIDTWNHEADLRVVSILESL